MYRSADQGITWKQKEEYKDISNKASKTHAQIGRVFHIEDSPVDPSLVFFLGDKGVNWLSEDCGGTFKPLNNGR